MKQINPDKMNTLQHKVPRTKNCIKRNKYEMKTFENNEQGHFYDYRFQVLLHQLLTLFAIAQNGRAHFWCSPSSDLVPN